MNTRNFGSLTGRLARDPKVFSNQDGSKKVSFTIMADRAFKNRNGEVDSDAIQVEVFIRKETDFASTPYANIHKGDLVQVETTLRQNTYTDAQGTTHYGIVVRVESISFLEPRSVTQNRLAQRINEAEVQNEQVAPQAAEQPVAEQLPFAG